MTLVDDARSGTPDRPPRRRASYANGERTRAALVQAAFEVFAEQGFQRLSIRQIAEAIGTSHTALLHHFGSKDALLEAVLAHREELEGPERAELIAERGLLDAVPEVMRHNATERGVIQLDTTLLVEAMHPDHIAHDFVRERDRAFVASVREQLERERELGRLRDGLDLDLVARLITAQVEGIQLAWLADDSIDMAAHLEALMDLLRAPGA
ncbi:MAG: helix-turn-helix domain-containing protein [Propionicimonas sp.]|uniref:TetR/AcrR family transcriptional regulator n=1 Tax=Propionicimonas sp. TaxID=1955623 RepID=UPI003D0E6483